MPLRSDIKKVLVIGSGPIIIGQAAEFDYAGTQACRALKQEGIEVVLINSNPATIMTDKAMADKVYIEPLTLDVVKRIIQIEKPDSLLSTMGGQTGLTLSMQLAEEGFLEASRYCDPEAANDPQPHHRRYHQRPGAVCADGYPWHPRRPQQAGRPYDPDRRRQPERRRRDHDAV